MKKLFIILTILLLAVSSYAWMTPIIIGGGVPSEAGCTTSNDSLIIDVYSGDCNSDDSNLNMTSTVWVAAQVVLSATTTVTEYKIRVQDANTSDSLVAQLYDNNTTPDPDEPDETSPVSNTDVTIGHADIDATYEDQLFTLATPTEVSSGTYWLILKATGSGQFQWAKDSGACNKTQAETADSGSNWSSETNYGARFELYGCE